MAFTWNSISDVCISLEIFDHKILEKVNVVVVFVAPIDV